MSLGCPSAAVPYLSGVAALRRATPLSPPFSWGPYLTLASGIWKIYFWADLVGADRDDYTPNGTNDAQFDTLSMFLSKYKGDCPMKGKIVYVQIDKGNLQVQTGISRPTIHSQQ